MKRRHMSVEEEFFAYGDEEIGGMYNRKNNQPAKTSSSLAKIIQILLVLVLIAILVVLGIIGYMYAKKALLGESESPPMAVEKKSVPPQPQQQPISSVQLTEHKSSSIIAAPKAQKLELKSAQYEKKVEKIEQKQSSSSLKYSSADTQIKDMSQMSDEELIAYLRTLKPDKLKKLDIEQLILERKQGATKEKRAVAKTEYLNNQVVVDKSMQAQKQKSQIAQISQKLATIVQSTPKNSADKQYIQGLMQEAKVREETNRYYIVAPGDTLSKIAKKFYGQASAYIKIYEANQDIIKDPKLIFPGQKLRIPNM